MNNERLFAGWMISAAVVLALALSPNPGTGSPDMNSPDSLLPLIPAPAAWSPESGSLKLDDLRRIVVEGGDHGLMDRGEMAAERLKDVLGRTLPVQAAGPGHPPAGSLLLQMNPDAAAEQYELRITGAGARLSAAGPAGFFHGVTTLLQLALKGPAAPCGLIEDRPRFAWRGMLLDCGRHFMPVDVIKGVLDRLALHKFNVLHWHLTEDQGWRLEIPGYPRLTEVGAWRTEADGSVYGGFYTAADVLEVLEYAAERSITVVPEIELPGHSQAALAAHPELSCTGGPFAVQTQWGIHEDILCAGREETFTFLEDVLTHVMELFPGGYIHIGGDEAPRERWKECPRCQERIREEGLSGEDDLQSWFIGRIGTFLAANGRRLIGWDEILDGGLPGDPAGYIVQAWRGMDKAAQAARAGHGVISSPTSHAYFDYDPGVLDLTQVHSFRPLPDGLDAAESARILGGQMNLWTEYIPPERVDRMLFPRLCAMAEAVWTGAEDRDFGEFLDRLEGHGPVLDYLKVTPGAPARPLYFTGRLDPDFGDHQLDVALDARVAAAWGDRPTAIRYLVLESPFPPSFQPAVLPEELDLPSVTLADDNLSGSLEIPSGSHAGSSWLALAQLFLDDRPYGAPAMMEVSGHAAVGADISLVHGPSDRYPGGGPKGLVNGLHGSRFFRDGLWSGFEGVDLEATVELEEPCDLRRISVRFLQDANSWIFFPREVVFQVSVDGKTWSEAGSSTHDISDKLQEKMIHEFALEVDTQAVKYVRVKASSPEACPQWHPGRGRPCWIFADEIVCR